MRLTAFRFQIFFPEEQSLPKKARKHKHKKSRDKSKKEKLYHTLTDDGAIIDEELQDCSATAEEILDMEGAANDKLESVFCASFLEFWSTVVI